MENTNADNELNNAMVDILVFKRELWPEIGPGIMKYPPTSYGETFLQILPKFLKRFDFKAETELQKALFAYLKIEEQKP